jgi:hypothetical protein
MQRCSKLQKPNQKTQGHTRVNVPAPKSPRQQFD